MRKVLINCLSGRSGGALSYLANALPRLMNLAAARSDLSLLILCDERQAQLVGEHDTERIQVPLAEGSGIARSWWERRNLPALVRARHIDAVFTPYQVESIRTGARSLLMIRNMEPFCYQCYANGWRHSLRNRTLKRMSDRSLKKADHIIAVSDYAAQYLTTQLRIDPARISRVYHGIDPSYSRPIAVRDTKASSYGDIPHEFLLTCGSLFPYRRCEDVIEAYAAIATQSMDKPDLLIAGDSPHVQYKAKLRQLAAELRIESHVRFLGHVDRDTLRALYQHAQAVLLATEVEACPNVAIESLASSSCILASSSPPLPEILGQAAVYYQPRNVADLQTRLQDLLDSEESRRKLKQAANSRAAQFSWDLCAQQTLDILANF
jgi:glycosyltransferase involved in cell wall biosynthesis